MGEGDEARRHARIAVSPPGFPRGVTSPEGRPSSRAARRPAKEALLGRRQPDDLPEGPSGAEPPRPSPASAPSSARFDISLRCKPARAARSATSRKGRSRRALATAALSPASAEPADEAQPPGGRTAAGVADSPSAPFLERAAPRGALDVDRQDAHAVALRVLHQRRRMVEAHRPCVEQRAEERRRGDAPSDTPTHRRAARSSPRATRGSRTARTR